VEAPNVAGDQGKMVLNRDGTDSQVRLAASDPGLFQFSLELPEYAAALGVEGQNGQVGKNTCCEGLEDLVFLRAAASPEIDFTNIDGAGELNSPVEIFEPFEQGLRRPGPYNFAQNVRIEEKHQILIFRSVSWSR